MRGLLLIDWSSLGPAEFDRLVRAIVLRQDGKVVVGIDLRRVNRCSLHGGRLAGTRDRGGRKGRLVGKDVGVLFEWCLQGGNVEVRTRK